MRRIVLAMALVLMPAVAKAQLGHPISAELTGPTRDDIAIRYGWLRQVAGFTFCDQNQGYSFVAADLAEVERLDTQAHELKHREQMARFPSCQAFDDAMITLKGRVMLEAEAYAAGLCVSVKHGADRAVLEMDYAHRISYAVAGRQVPPVVIAGIIRSFEGC